MSAPEFGTAVNELIDAAAQCPTALMCAERLPWQCHRQLIADFLVVRGINMVRARVVHEEEKKEEAAPLPRQEVLLEEIRDLLAKREGSAV